MDMAGDRAHYGYAARPIAHYARRMDRAALEQQLQEARDEIAKGERQISRQWDIIQELERDGHNSNLARKVLAKLLQTQEEHLEHRDQLVKMLEALGSPEPTTPEGA